MEPFRPVVDQIVYQHRDLEFKKIKSALFAMFTNKYSYNDKEMYLTNIISDYTKRVIKVLNNETEGVPVFRI